MSQRSIGSTPRRLIRLRTVLERVPYHATTIWRKELDGDFPKRVQLGGNSVAWFVDEIDAWVESRERGCVDPSKKFKPKTRTTASDHSEPRKARR